MAGMRLAALLLLAVSLSGCLWWSGDEPLLEFPYADLVSARTDATYDAFTRQLEVRVTGEVRTQNGAEEAVVVAYVIHEPCGMGPRGAPSAHQGRAQEVVAAPGGAFDFTVRSSPPAGTRYAVIVIAEPIGPGAGFGSCVDGIAGAERGGTYLRG